MRKETLAKIPRETEQELITRKEVWIKTRKIGFMSFTIPSTIILLMIAFSNQTLKNSLWPLQSGLDGSLSKTAIYFCIWTNIEVFLNIGKYYLCRKMYGMTQKDYRIIIGRRDRWTKEHIGKLEDKYGMYNLKQMDAIYRRSGHIIVNLWRIFYFLYICNDQTQRLQVSIMHLPIIFFIKKQSEFRSIGAFVF